MFPSSGRPPLSKDGRDRRIEWNLLTGKGLFDSIPALSAYLEVGGKEKR
jgi:hypothetical protein